MTNTNTLFNAYTDYVNGNKAAFTALFSVKQTDNETKLVIKDSGLTQMVHKAFKDFTTPCVFPIEDKKHYTKFNRSVFTGTEADMADLYLLELQNLLAQNKVFENESQLYGALKYSLDKTGNEIIDSYDTFAEIPAKYEKNRIKEEYDYFDEEMKTYDLTDAYAIQQFENDNPYLKIEQKEHGENNKSKTRGYNYNGLAFEALQIVKNSQFKDMLQTDSRIAKDLIDILLKYECTMTDSNGITKRIKHKDMADLFEKVYGYKPYVEELSKAYNTVYNLIMNSLFGNIPISRTDFCGKDDDDEDDKEKSEQKDKDKQKNMQKDEGKQESKTIEHIATPEETAYYMKLLEKDREYYRWNREWSNYNGDKNK